MDFIPNVPGEGPRLVGPAGDISSFANFFASAGGGGLSSGFSVVPGSRPDPALPHSDSLKINSPTQKQHTKCSFPHRPSGINITKEIGHNGAADNHHHALQSPVGSPVLISGSKACFRPLRSRSLTIDASEVDGPEALKNDTSPPAEV